MTYTTAVASFSTFAQAYSVAQAKRDAFFVARHAAASEQSQALTQWRGANWDHQLGTTQAGDIGLQVDFLM